MEINYMIFEDIFFLYIFEHGKQRPNYNHKLKYNSFVLLYFSKVSLFYNTL